MGNLSMGSVSEDEPFGSYFDSADTQQAYYVYRSVDCHARLDVYSALESTVIEHEGGIHVGIAKIQDLFFVFSAHDIAVCEEPLHHLPLSVLQSMGYVPSMRGVIYPSQMPKRRSPPDSTIDLSSSSPQLNRSESLWRTFVRRMTPGKLRRPKSGLH